MVMDGWKYPEEWKVGDDLNAETLNSRIRDQNLVLLKRPLTVAHSAASQVNAINSWRATTFDTVDIDDDGMVIETLPTTNFYAQRAGIYQVWANVDFRNPGAANTYALAFWLNGSSGSILYRQQRRMGGFGSTIDFCHSISGIVALGVGEYIQLNSWNGSGVDVLNLTAINSCPRIGILWLGPN
jgi:hypothetical protein